MKTTITIEQANQKVDDWLTQVRQALPPEATYELSSSEERGSCLDPADGGSQERVVANRTYKVLGLPKDMIPSYFDALRSWWQNHNFRILDNTPPNEFLWVENNNDGFRMTFQASPQGNLFLIASSPCVWPGGVPGPKAIAPEQPESTADQAAAAPQAQPDPAAQPAPRPRRPRPSVDDEDFDQVDWTDNSRY